MNLLKKYHLWWLIPASIVSFMFANLTLFAITGFSFIPSLNPLHFLAQAIVSFVSGGVMFGGWRNRHKK